MRRALDATVPLRFQELGLAGVEARTSATNERAHALLERVGFEHEGTLRAARSFVEERRDLAVYAVIRPGARSTKLYMIPPATPKAPDEMTEPPRRCGAVLSFE